MRRLILLAAVLVPAASAQPVVLGGWALPHGRTVCGESTFEYAAVWSDDDGVAIDTLMVEDSAGEAAVCWTDFETRDGRLVGADETMARWNVHHQSQSAGPAPRPNPMLGVPLRLTLQPDGIWTARLRDGAPTPEQERSLPDVYTFDLAPGLLPVTPLVPGDAWNVPTDVLALRMGPLDPATPSTYRIRLDSLAGGRAYVTHDADVATASGGQRARLLLHRRAVLDVATRIEVEVEIDQTRTSESAAIDAYGLSDGISRIESHLHFDVHRTVETPPGP